MLDPFTNHIIAFTHHTIIIIHIYVLPHFKLIILRARGARCLFLINYFGRKKDAHFYCGGGPGGYSDHFVFQNSLSMKAYHHEFRL